jgi:hypothetical protein
VNVSIMPERWCRQLHRLSCDTSAAAASIGLHRLVCLPVAPCPMPNLGPGNTRMHLRAIVSQFFVSSDPGALHTLRVHVPMLSPETTYLP